MTESELRRQATAAGVFLDLEHVTCELQAGQLVAVEDSKLDITADETERLLVWLDDWQERPPRERPLLRPPAGFELVRHSWCPRCNRIGGDPLGWWHDFGSMKGYLRRPRCAVFPPPPELEIGQGCDRALYGRRIASNRTRNRFPDMPGAGFWTRVCSARQLFRWGLRWSHEIKVLRPTSDDSLFEALQQLATEEMSKLGLGLSIGGTADPNRANGIAGMGCDLSSIRSSPLQEMARAHQAREHRRARRLFAHRLPHDISDRALAEWLGHRVMVPPEMAVLMGLDGANVREWFT
jgi:hypothetical protein